jgi:broad specificity phosphatase PhoE
VATRLLLARHGETDWNRERRWQGLADTALNEVGRRQARALAEELAAEPPDAVYTSDLARARETAEIVADALRLPVVVDDRLREVDVGAWSGLTAVEIETRFPGKSRPGESAEAMGARVIEALLEIAGSHDGGRVLVVTHGGPMRAAWLACGGSLENRPVVSNCHVQPIRVEGREMARID